MNLLYLGVGNNYASQSYSLPDCALDVENVASDIEPFISWGKCLVDGKGVRKNFLKAFAELKAKKKASDAVMLYYSGHGTSDVINGKRVQGIVWEDGTVCYEDELRAMLADISPLILFADCCFSGGLSKARGRNQPKFVPMSHLFVDHSAIPTKTRRRTYEYMAACKVNQTADSTGHGGAFTNAVREVFAVHPERLTFASLFKGVRKILPNSEHDQVPQLVYSDDAFVNRTLKSFVKKWNKKPA